MNADDAAYELVITLDLPDELKIVLGEITIAYGQLEFALAMCIKRTDKAMEIEEALTIAESFTTLTATAESQFGVWYCDQHREAQFENLVNKASALAKRRHNVSHALWARNRSGEICWLRNGWYKPVVILELQSLRDEIFEVACELNGTTRNDGVVTFDEKTSAAASYRIIGPDPI